MHHCKDFRMSAGHELFHAIFPSPGSLYGSLHLGLLDLLDPLRPKHMYMYLYRSQSEEGYLRRGTLNYFLLLQGWGPVKTSPSPYIDVCIVYRMYEVSEVKVLVIITLASFFPGSPFLSLF